MVDGARGQRPSTIDPYDGLKSTEIFIPRTKASLENPDILCPGSVEDFEMKIVDMVIVRPSEKKDQ